jgi:AcrR family transcriptional regulator
VPNTRKRLLDAAVEVFSEQGYSGASTREIARRAKINPVTLFRLFGGKQQLHAAIIEHLFELAKMREQLEEGLQRCRSGEELVAAIIRNIAEVLDARPEVYRIILYAALERKETVFESVWKQLTPVYEVVSASVEKAIKQGQFREVSPKLAARVITAAAIYHHQLFELYGAKKRKGFTRKHLFESYAKLIYQGLRPS